jgi:hypothetical protein
MRLNALLFVGISIGALFSECGNFAVYLRAVALLEKKLMPDSPRR